MKNPGTLRRSSGSIPVPCSIFKPSSPGDVQSRARQPARYLDTLRQVDDAFRRLAELQPDAFDCQAPELLAMLNGPGVTGNWAQDVVPTR